MIEVSGARDHGAGTDAAGGRGALPLLLCLSHLRWDFVFQRPQHLLTRAAATHRVVVVEEPVFDADEPRLELSARGPVTVAVPHLTAGLGPEADEIAQRQLIDALVAREGRPAILWFYAPMAMAFAGHLDAGAVVYDCMDELSAFHGANPRLVDQEARLFARADVVFTGGHSLFEAKRGRHPNVHAFPSSIEQGHFARALALRADLDRAEPADQAAVPHPRAGFFGVVDERMDVALVGRLAMLRPGVSFVMIGPVVKIDPATLPRAANLHWLGGKSYAELPDYLAGWDTGFMPFALNEATRFISPTKTPEFLAAGVPVVSTPIADVVRPYGERGLVEIADGAEAMAAALDRLLALPRGPFLTEVGPFLATGSWDRTWAAMAGAIEVAAAANAAGAARDHREPRARDATRAPGAAEDHPIPARRAAAGARS